MLQIILALPYLLSLLVLIGCDYSNRNGQRLDAKEPLDSESLARQRVFKTLSDALAEPDTVYRLALQAEKLGFVLPKTIGQLRKVQELAVFCNLDEYHHLGGSPLKNIPGEIGLLTNLQHLNLSWSSVSSLPQEFSHLKALRTLDLYECGFTELPPLVGELTNLEELDLSINYLQALPKELAKCQKLRKLRLGLNHFNDFPKVIFELENLEELSLHSVYFKNPELPDKFDKLRNLQILDLHGIKVNYIPETVWGLTRLRELDIVRINVNGIDRNLLQLANLEKLSLSVGQIENLATLGRLTQLRRLGCDDSGQGNTFEMLREILPDSVKIVPAF